MNFEVRVERLFTDDEEHRIRAHPRVRIEGTVLDGTGRPVDARVFGEVFRLSADESVKHGALVAGPTRHGRFVAFAPRAIDGEYVLRIGADATGYLPGQVKVEAVGWTATVVLRMERAPSVKGQVVDEAGEAVRGATAQLACRRRVGATRRATRDWLSGHLASVRVVRGPKGATALQEFVVRKPRPVDGAGRFELTPMFRSDYLFVILRAPGRPPVAKEMSGAGDAAIELGRVSLAGSSAPVPVFFRTPEGLAAADLEVLFQWLEVSPELQVNTPWLKSDESGAVASNFLNAGDLYRVFYRSRSEPARAGYADRVIERGTTIVVAFD